MTAFRSTHLLAPALLAAALASPLAAVAQTASASPSAVAAPMAPAAPVPVDTGRAKHAMERVEHRINELHRRLKITPAQEAAWSTFAGVMRENAERMETTFATNASADVTISAPDHMREYAKIAEAHAQDVDKLVPAFDQLYGIFSADQKKNADDIFRNYAERSGRRGRG